MQFSDIKNIKVGKLLGSKVKYQSTETMRRRIGVVYGVDFRRVRVQNRDRIENVPFGLVDEILGVE
jgi:ABC-type ATPase involved in cell division